jgi:hypothetical protein
MIKLAAGKEIRYEILQPLAMPTARINSDVIHVLLIASLSATTALKLYIMIQSSDPTANPQ